MTNINKYKPRYTLSYLTKSKVWPYKDSYLRNFFRIRARWVKPKGKVQKYIIVAKNRKWTEARNFFRPNSIRIDKKLIFGKSAYGRPQSASRRYNNLFYIKQKLRSFYGKVKEATFLNLFKTHKMRMAMQTNSFFNSLESRLDRIFFRIRLLPTVFACHQFIHYNGLEINNKLEKSPRKEVKIGDVVTVPAIAWITFYWHIYYRIYYRRWGRYIFKRRLIKKVNKILSLNFNIKGYIKKNPLSIYKKTISRTKDIYIPKVKAKYFINKLTNLIEFFEEFIVSNKDLNVKRDTTLILESGITNLVITNNMKVFDKFSAILVKLREKLDAIKDKKEIDIIEKEVEELQQLFIKVKQYQKLYINSFLFSEWKEEYQQKIKKSIQGRVRNKDHRREDISISNKAWKVQRTKEAQKVKRTRKPEKQHIWRNKRLTSKWNKLSVKRNIDLNWDQIRSNVVGQSFSMKGDQTTLIRLFWNIVKKAKRKQITTRLKPVHFFIPSYVQVDFRTLSFIKIGSTTYKDIHYPFQISLSKTYSFYKSQGFLSAFLYLC